MDDNGGIDDDALLAMDIEGDIQTTSGDIVIVTQPNNSSGVYESWLLEKEVQMMEMRTLQVFGQPQDNPASNNAPDTLDDDKPEQAEDDERDQFKTYWSPYPAKIDSNPTNKNGGGSGQQQDYQPKRYVGKKELIKHASTMILSDFNEEEDESSPVEDMNVEEEDNYDQKDNKLRPRRVLFDGYNDNNNGQGDLKWITGTINFDPFDSRYHEIICSLDREYNLSDIITTPGDRQVLGSVFTIAEFRFYNRGIVPCIPWLYEVELTIDPCSYDGSIDFNELGIEPLPIVNQLVSIKPLVFDTVSFACFLSFITKLEPSFLAIQFKRIGYDLEKDICNDSWLKDHCGVSCLSQIGSDLRLAFDASKIVVAKIEEQMEMQKQNPEIVPSSSADFNDEEDPGVLAVFCRHPETVRYYCGNILEKLTKYFNISWLLGLQVEAVYELYEVMLLPPPPLALGKENEGLGLIRFDGLQNSVPLSNEAMEKINCFLPKSVPPFYRLFFQMNWCDKWHDFASDPAFCNIENFMSAPHVYGHNDQPLRMKEPQLVDLVRIWQENRVIVSSYLSPEFFMAVLVAHCLRESNQRDLHCFAFGDELEMRIKIYLGLETDPDVKAQFIQAYYDLFYQDWKPGKEQSEANATYQLQSMWQTMMRLGRTINIFDKRPTVQGQIKQYLQALIKVALRFLSNPEGLGGGCFVVEIPDEYTGGTAIDNYHPFWSSEEVIPLSMIRIYPIETYIHESVIVTRVGGLFKAGAMDIGRQSEEVKSERSAFYEVAWRELWDETMFMHFRNLLSQRIEDYLCELAAGDEVVLPPSSSFPSATDDGIFDSFFKDNMTQAEITVAMQRYEETILQELLSKTQERGNQALPDSYGPGTTRKYFAPCSEQRLFQLHILNGFPFNITMGRAGSGKSMSITNLWQLYYECRPQLNRFGVNPVPACMKMVGLTFMATFANTFSQLVIGDAAQRFEEKRQSSTSDDEYENLLPFIGTIHMFLYLHQVMCTNRETITPTARQNIITYRWAKVDHPMFCQARKWCQRCPLEHIERVVIDEIRTVSNKLAAKLLYVLNRCSRCKELNEQGDMNQLAAPGEPGDMAREVGEGMGCTINEHCHRSDKTGINDLSKSVQEGRFEWHKFHDGISTFVVDPHRHINNIRPGVSFKQLSLPEQDEAIISSAIELFRPDGDNREFDINEPLPYSKVMSITKTNRIGDKMGRKLCKLRLEARTIPLGEHASYFDYLDRNGGPKFGHVYPGWWITASANLNHINLRRHQRLLVYDIIEAEIYHVPYAHVAMIKGAIFQAVAKTIESFTDSVQGGGFSEIDRNEARGELPSKDARFAKWAQAITKLKEAYHIAVKNRSQHSLDPERLKVVNEDNNQRINDMRLMASIKKQFRRILNDFIRQNAIAQHLTSAVVAELKLRCSKTEVWHMQAGSDGPLTTRNIRHSFMNFHPDTWHFRLVSDTPFIRREPHRFDPKLHGSAATPGTFCWIGNDDDEPCDAYDQQMDDDTFNAPKWLTDLLLATPEMERYKNIPDHRPFVSMISMWTSEVLQSLFRDMNGDGQQMKLNEVFNGPEAIRSRLPEPPYKSWVYREELNTEQINRVEEQFVPIKPVMRMGVMEYFKTSLFRMPPHILQKMGIKSKSPRQIEAYVSKLVTVNDLFDVRLIGRMPHSHYKHAGGSSRYVSGRSQRGRGGRQPQRSQQQQSHPSEDNGNQEPIDLNSTKKTRVKITFIRCFDPRTMVVTMVPVIPAITRFIKQANVPTIYGAQSQNSPVIVGVIERKLTREALNVIISRTIDKCILLITEEVARESIARSETARHSLMSQKLRRQYIHPFINAINNDMDLQRTWNLMWRQLEQVRRMQKRHMEVGLGKEPLPKTLLEKCFKRELALSFSIFQHLPLMNENEQTWLIRSQARDIGPLFDPYGLPYNRNITHAEANNESEMAYEYEDF